jgi:dipeptidyl aminopeptidase/acylaminoacyl peptidase
MISKLICAVLALCLTTAIVSLPVHSEEAETYYLYTYSSNFDTRMGRFDIRDASGTILIEDIASYYPPVDPGYNLRIWRYSPSRRWIVTSSKAVRPESLYNEALGRNFLIDTTTDTVIPLTPDDQDDGMASWAPTQDILAFGSYADLNGFLRFQFYNPQSGQFRPIRLSDGSPLGIAAIDRWVWAPDEDRLMMRTFETRYTEEGWQDSPLISLLTVRMDGSGMVVLHSTNDRDDGFPYGLTYDWSVLGIITECSDMNQHELCLIDPVTGEWKLLYQLPTELSGPDHWINRFKVSPDGNMLYVDVFTQVEIDGQTQYYKQLIAHDLSSGSERVIEQTEPGYGLAIVQISTYIPPDILDGTRPRWAERAEATAAAPGG